MQREQNLRYSMHKQLSVARSRALPRAHSDRRFAAACQDNVGLFFGRQHRSFSHMAILTVLFASWLVFRGIGALGVSALATWRGSACYALAVMFVFTGVAHFNKMKHDLAQMVPAIFPRPLLLVYFTGILEFMGVAGLLLPRFRSLAGLCLIALLIVMFPANVNAALKGTMLRGKPATPLWLRAPMQLLFIGILWCSSRP